MIPVAVRASEAGSGTVLVSSSDSVKDSWLFSVGTKSELKCSGPGFCGSVTWPGGWLWSGESTFGPGPLDGGGSFAAGGPFSGEGGASLPV